MYYIVCLDAIRCPCSLFWVLATTVKMKLFVIILPTVILSCECVNRCNNDSTPISVVPGKPTILPIATLSSTDISISFDNPITSFEFHKSIKGNVSLSIYSDLNCIIGVTIASNKSQCNITIKTLPLCPPGFSFDEKRKTCTCLNLMKLYPIFKCNHENFTAKVLVDYCVNLDNNNTLATRCPFAGLQSDVYTLLEQVNNRSFCAGLNRHLSYCHNCIDDHGVSVYSDTFKCIYCKSSRWSDILWYVAFETIPASIFFLFVLYFHIGVTSGPANGFIFFSQIVTMPFEVTFLRFVTTLAITSLSNFRYLTRVFVDSVIDPYSIWSLDGQSSSLTARMSRQKRPRAFSVDTTPSTNVPPSKRGVNKRTADKWLAEYDKKLSRCTIIVQRLSMVRLTFVPQHSRSTLQQTCTLEQCLCSRSSSLVAG